LFVHCCHCSWCQRETGSAFALNAMVEADRVELTAARSSWSHAVGQRQGPEDLALPAVQGGAVEQLLGLGRQGALHARRHARHAGAMPPDIHIFTSTKQPWVVLPPGAKAVPEFYKPRETWPKDTQERFAAVREK
jgi:hypothetical protein